jgi:hypothetical protein
MGFDGASRATGGPVRMWLLCSSYSEGGCARLSADVRDVLLQLPDETGARASSAKPFDDVDQLSEPVSVLSGEGH